MELYILQDGLDVDGVAEINNTPLIKAFDLCYKRCVVKLLDAGGNLNVYEYDGWSAPH